MRLEYKRRILPGIAVLLALFGTNSVQAGDHAAPVIPAPAQSITDDEVQARMQAFVEQARAAPGVVVALSDNGKRRLFAHGHSGDRGKPPLGSDARFEIGSISKGLNGMLLAQMIGSGEVRAEDTIAALIPDGGELPAAIGTISLEELATHHSGLPRLAYTPSRLRYLLADNLYAGSTPEEVFDSLAYVSEAAVEQRRGNFNYSNLAVAVLGQLLATRAGQPYEALLQQRVLTPLGIEKATFMSGTTPSGATPGHRAGRPQAAWRMDAYTPAGGVVMNASDLLSVGEQMLAQHPAFVAESLRPRRSSEGNGQVALGWFHDRIGAQPVIWHNGGTSGSRSFLGIVPQTNQVVVVLANGDGNVDALAAGLIDPSRAPPSRKTGWTGQVLTALGLFGIPLWLWLQLRTTTVRRPDSKRDRLRTLTVTVEAIIALLMLARLGNWTLLPWPLFWLSAAASGIALVLLVRQSRRLPWLHSPRFRTIRVLRLLLALAVVILMLGPGV